MKEKLRIACLALALLLLGPYICTAQTTGPSDKKENWAAVTGEVRNPTRIKLSRRVRLLEALAFAGGVREGAKGGVRVEHISGEVDMYRLDDLKRGDEKANPILRAGDVVAVLK